MANISFLRIFFIHHREYRLREFIIWSPLTFYQILLTNPSRKWWVSHGRICMWTLGFKGQTYQIVTSPWSFFVTLSKLFNFRDLNTHHCSKFFFKLTAPWRICMYVHPRVIIYLNKLFLSEITVSWLVQFWPLSPFSLSCNALDS